MRVVLWFGFTYVGGILAKANDVVAPEILVTIATAALVWAAIGDIVDLFRSREK